MDNAKLKELDLFLTRNANRGEFISLETFTTAGILKPCGKIVKTKRDLKDGEKLITKKSAFVSQAKTSYMNRVTKKNPDYEFKARKWGIRTSDNVVEHKDSLYLETIHDPDSKMPKPKTVYFVDGIETDKSELDLKETESQSGIVVRTFKSESIVLVKAHGELFK